MANGAASATLQVGFANELSKPAIKITPHPEYNDADLGIPLRVYPPDVSLAASVGTITKKNVLSEEIQGELVRFSGSSEAKFTYTPAEEPPPAELVFGFDSKGDPLLFPPQFGYEIKTGTIKAYRIVAGEKQPFAFYGLVRVPKYRAEYLKFYYKPAIEYQKTGMMGIYGAVTTFGTVAAYKEGTIELYEVPTTDTTSGKYRNEIYRIVSQTVIDPEGEWELPETWGPSYEGRYDNNDVGPQYDTAVVKERIHEYGYVDSYGFFHYEVFRRYLGKPYDSIPRKITNANTFPFQPKIEMISKNPKDVFDDYQKPLQERLAGYIAKRKTYDLILGDYQKLTM
jgi:hypothetical protein